MSTKNKAQVQQEARAIDETKKKTQVQHGGWPSTTMSLITKVQRDCWQEQKSSAEAGNGEKSSADAGNNKSSVDAGSKKRN
jgi:hypothetical protein